MGRVSIRHAEPDDYEAIHRILSSPRATAGTLQVPLQSLEGVRKRFFSETREGLYQLVACVEEEVVGHLGLETFTRPRRRHVGEIGMAVRDDWQGKGIGSALMEAALDLADNWLNLIRLELTVYTDKIDILCQDAEGNFVVIELKRGKAPDRVVAQVDRYMEWVERNLAQPDHKVRGLIIARSADQHLSHILARRSNIDLYLYDWRLKLNHWESQQGAQSPKGGEEVDL